jgi:hypothetical protein
MISERKSINRKQSQCWKLGGSQLMHQTGGKRLRKTSKGHQKNEARKEHARKNLGMRS